MNKVQLIGDGLTEMNISKEFDKMNVNGEDILLNSNCNLKELRGVVYDVPVTLMTIDLTCLKVLILNKCQLSALPDDLSGLRNLRSLDLSCNLLRSLPDGCRYMNKLISLDLSNNLFINTPKCLKYGLIGALVELNFSSNNLIEFNVNSKSLQLLKSLNLQNNRLSSVPSWLIYNGYSTLKHLDLSCNKENIFNNITQNNTLYNILYMRNSIAKTLDSINLSCCSIKKSNIFVISSFSVTKLTLSNTFHSYYDERRNILYAVPLRCLPNVANLTELYMSYVNLGDLQSDIKDFVKLKVLDVSHNEISKLPVELCSLVNLTVLDASNNDIQVLPDCIGQLRNLKCLYLSTNEISSLPDGIEMLQDLEVLDLYNNYLRCVPNVFCWRSLKGLDLDFNEILRGDTNSLEVECKQITLDEVPNYKKLREAFIKSHRNAYIRNSGQRPMFESTDCDNSGDEKCSYRRHFSDEEYEPQNFNRLYSNVSTGEGVVTEVVDKKEEEEEDWDKCSSDVDENFVPTDIRKPVRVAAQRKWDRESEQYYTPSDFHPSSIFQCNFKRPPRVLY